MAASTLVVYTHLRNAVLLVWGSLRLAPISFNKKVYQACALVVSFKRLRLSNVFDQKCVAGLQLEIYTEYATCRQGVVIHVLLQ